MRRDARDRAGWRGAATKALSMFVKGSKTWNSLSPDIKVSRNVNAFKKMLKASLLKNYKTRQVLKLCCNVITIID